MAEHPDYYTIITGHSLGAGASITLSLLLRKYPKKYRNVRRYPLAPPMSINQKFISSHPQLFKHITCICFEKDVIPRLSVQSILSLRSEMKLLFPYIRHRSNLWVCRKTLCCRTSSD